MADEKITVAAISDDPRLSTGFGNVANQIYKGLHESGFIDLHAFGIMGTKPDVKRELPYSYWPCNEFDLSGHRTIPAFITEIQPDIVFIISDPGNILEIMKRIEHMIIFSIRGDHPKLKKFKVVVYTPTEGFPIPNPHAVMMDKVERTGGKVVLYSPGSVERVNQQYSNLDLEWVYHGSDHADFTPVDEEYKRKLRELIGLEDYFLCGSVGVNKRTKGFDTLIYTARCLKDMDMHHSILFYFHTSPQQPVMEGYDLKDLAKKYDVEDMIIWKPESDKDPGGNRHGIERLTEDDIFNKSLPTSAEEQRRNLMSLGFIDRLRMLDLYTDASSAEGWGLPAFESMATGIPVITVDDNGIRREVHSKGAEIIEPLPFRVWTTWHVGSKLPLIDPLDMAEKILELKNDPEKRKTLSKKGVQVASKYKWKDSAEKMSNIIKKVHNQEWWVNKDEQEQ